MAGTRKARVPMTEQIRFISECRQGGMTDADWCRENDIAVITFIFVAAGKAGRWITSGHDGFFVRHYNFAVLALGRRRGRGVRCFRIRIP